MDLLGRSLRKGGGTTPEAVLRGYLSGGATATARALARKPVVLLEPADGLGTVVWPPDGKRG